MHRSICDGKGIVPLFSCWFSWLWHRETGKCKSSGELNTIIARKYNGSEIGMYEMSTVNGWNILMNTFCSLCEYIQLFLPLRADDRQTSNSTNGKSNSSRTGNFNQCWWCNHKMTNILIYKHNFKITRNIDLLLGLPCNRQCYCPLGSLVQRYRWDRMDLLSQAGTH